MNISTQLTQRVFDALLGLRDGRIVIGGPKAKGLHDDPVVRVLYDRGFIHVVSSGRSIWCLTLNGHRHAEALADIVKRIEVRE